ncbi:MAG TPA: hypothetical protein VGY58_24040 [Gemmataceae bacterium]|nr:hypothetical protein [Gemmataceae bacterium]
MNVRGPHEKADAWMTTPLDDFAAVAEAEWTVRARGGSSIVSGQIPANALLSVVLRKAPSGD